MQAWLAYLLNMCMALNSYVLFFFPFFQMLIFLSTTGKFTFENNAKSCQNIRFSNNLVTRFMPEQYNWMKCWATCAV